MLHSIHYSSIPLLSIPKNYQKECSLRFYWILINFMLLLTNCEVHTGKYLDRSFEVQTERSEVRTKN